MKPSPREEGLRWLHQAQQDLDDARYAFDGKRFNLVCFLAQQAAEKAIKGFTADADRALELAKDVIRFVEGRFPPEEAIDDEVGGGG